MSHKTAIKLFHIQSQSDFKMHRAVAKGNEISLQTINLVEEPLTPRQLFQLSTNFEGGLKGLVDTSSEAYKNELKSRNYSDQELLEILVKNPKLLKLPIIAYQKETHICNKARDILKFSSLSPNINSHDHSTSVK